MQSFDFYPFDDAMRAELLTSIHDALSLLQGSAPVAPPPTPPHTYQRRYGRTFCVTCGLDAEYCRQNAHAAAEAASGDGAHSDLQRRINEAQKK